MRVSKKILAVAMAGAILAGTAGTAMAAYNRYDPYAISPNATKRITHYVPGESTIYIQTRPDAGGDLRVTLSGAKSASAIFPYYTTRNAWKVTGVKKNATLYIDGTATSGGTSGRLRSWSD